MTAQWPDEVVEAVAKSLHGCDAYLDAIAVLSALSPAAQAVICGEAVAVPKEGSSIMLNAIEDRVNICLVPDESGEGMRLRDGGALSVWRYVLAASPYDEKEPTP